LILDGSPLRFLQVPITLARVIVGERGSDLSDLAPVADDQEKFSQMEARAADASVPGETSRMAPNSDLKLTGIRCRRLKEPIIVEHEFIDEPKIARQKIAPEESLSRGKDPPSESSSDSERKQILTHEDFDQTQKRLGSQEEKQSPIEGPRRNRKQGDNASPRPRRQPNSQTDAGSFTEFENAESIGQRDDLV
jgi:hypothetical protein